MTSEYVVVDGAPDADDYARLRCEAGLSPVSPEQAARAVVGGWFACHVVRAAHDDEPDEVVAMGRVIGDGAWYFHVIDMAVLPGHQRRGLGDAVLTRLLREIRTQAPPHAWVNLLADAPGRGLYARHGFTQTAPDSLGMGMRLL
ncbi:GNAT family N-acetyltransferase [Cellulomonas sp. JH27-2]|uniref:GNAT family N-acetyltransferase n=1 Tax=Cellulomonas sp. JH27-2 TaxID=2774139 RepID=UPI001781517A|nr:GNAT family N-acetyltransferase [Cellulomonas sp. JH27-2]